MLDEFVAMTGCHREHALRLLGQGENGSTGAVPRGRRIYDEAVREALTVVWEASDRMCGKRLKAALPSMVESLERHGHLNLDPYVRQRLFAASASTIDRLIKPIREQAGSRRKRRQKRKMGSRIPIRTLSYWNEPEPGYLEIDLVAHCGESVAGSFISSLAVTDVCSGWTEEIPLLAREQSLVVEGLEAISRLFPVPIRGIDSDNDSVFINETLLSYCVDRDMEFTRSLAQHKNDQAWDRAKERFGHTALRRSQPLLRTDSRSGSGSPVRCHASVCEPPPPIIQAAGQEPQRRHRQEAVRETCYSLRPPPGARRRE